jgi:hypothetical protein
MTTEERARMNDLCIQIQNEKSYPKFEELMREVTALMSAKESRFPESKFAPVGTGHKILHATAMRTMKGFNSGDTEVVEIHLAGAEPLYSEIRVENSFNDDRGNVVSIQTPAPVDLKIQAPSHRFALRSPRQTTS